MTNTGQFVRRICRHCSVVGEHQYIGETHIMCASCSSVGCDTADALPRKPEPIEANARRVLAKRVDPLAPTLPPEHPAERGARLYHDASVYAPSNGHAAAEPDHSVVAGLQDQLAAVTRERDEAIDAWSKVRSLVDNAAFDQGEAERRLAELTSASFAAEMQMRDGPARAALHAVLARQARESATPEPAPVDDDLQKQRDDAWAREVELQRERDQLKAELAAARERADRYDDRFERLHAEMRAVLQRGGKEAG